VPAGGHFLLAVTLARYGYQSLRKAVTSTRSTVWDDLCCASSYWSDRCFRGSATAEGNEIDEDVTMLRITVHKNSQATRLQLEGRLAGPWVTELDECWRLTFASESQPNIEVDLTGLISIDSEGKACLAALHHRGASFVVADCETKSIVDEIVQKSSP
jgi:ABC-type transporter Mla MlaB component